MKLINNVVHEAVFGEFFNVKLSEDENPAIKTTIDFEGMPIEVLLKLAFNEIKVRLRPEMKKLKIEKLKQVFHNQTVSWRTITKEYAKGLVEESDMTDEELEAEIQRLKQKVILRKKTEAKKTENRE